MATRIILLLSTLSFLFSIGFSIYFSNTIANFNYLYSQKIKSYESLQLKKAQLLDSFNFAISPSNLIDPDTSILNPITKSIP